MHFMFVSFVQLMFLFAIDADYDDNDGTEYWIGEIARTFPLHIVASEKI